MDIIKLISKSGDSYLKDFRYVANKAILILEIDELDRAFQIYVKTKLMAIDIPESKEIPYRTCHIELKRLSELLELRNGIYIASQDFGKFMQEKRKNLNLAYGLKREEGTFIFSIDSSKKMISLIVKNLEDIEIEEYVE